MTTLTLKDISAAMRSIDVCMLATFAGEEMVSRPMSNNRDVDYAGDSYFFANGDCSAARAISENPQVNLAFSHEPALLGKPFYLSVTGHARLVRDRAEMEKHWVKDVEVWFKQGLDTPGLVMIHVKAVKLHYWHGGSQGKLLVA